MLTSPTKVLPPVAPQAGFTLLELMVALAVVALLSVISLPSFERMNDSMRYREAVRDLVTAARTARRDALARGESVDLLILTDEPAWAVLPAARAPSVVDDTSLVHALPEELLFDATYAQEVSPGGGIASIRFYPGGGASGGDIDIVRPTGVGVRLKIDWLLGEVVQVPVTL